MNLTNKESIKHYEERGLGKIQHNFFWNAQCWSRFKCIEKVAVHLNAVDDKKSFYFMKTLNDEYYTKYLVKWLIRNVGTRFIVLSNHYADYEENHGFITNVKRLVSYILKFWKS